jgi:hypothetical protein
MADAWIFGLRTEWKFVEKPLARESFLGFAETFSNDNDPLTYIPCMTLSPPLSGEKTTFPTFGKFNRFPFFDPSLICTSSFSPFL